LRDRIRIVFSLIPTTFWAWILALIFAWTRIENGSQNEAKIDAEIEVFRFWVAGGAANVDLEHFLVAFGRVRNSNDF